MSGSRLGQREGQVVQGAWGGPVLLARFQTGQQFAQSYVAQRVCRTAEFTGGGPLQRESNDMNAQIAPYAQASGSRAQAAVGEVYFRRGDATAMRRRPPSLTPRPRDPAWSCGSSTPSMGSRSRRPWTPRLPCMSSTP